MPSQVAWLVWLHGGSCDGCTMSVLGATSPRLEELLGGTLTRTRLDIVHPALALDAGARYLDALERAAGGSLDPFVLVVEGTMFDQRRAGDGAFSSLGERDGRPIVVEEWVVRLARRAAVVIAIGTCAVWGGVPAARGNVTGAMGLGELIGTGFRSREGLQVVNLPGCAPSGDAFVETLQYVLLHLEGLVPLDLDDEGRPRWIYASSTPVQPASVPSVASRAEAGLLADCPVPVRGWINRLGGCAAVGGACNGCTRRDFPDRVLPVVAAI